MSNKLCGLPVGFAITIEDPAEWVDGGDNVSGDQRRRDTDGQAPSLELALSVPSSSCSTTAMCGICTRDHSGIEEPQV